MTARGWAITPGGWLEPCGRPAGLGQEGADRAIEGDAGLVIASAGAQPTVLGS